MRIARSSPHSHCRVPRGRPRAPRPRSTKVFRYAFEVAETGFDPAEISDLYSSNVIANIFDTPLTYDYLARPLKLVPNTLAAMPEITESGTLYTMRVKPGIYFADDPAFKGKKRELTAAGLRLLDQAHLRPEEALAEPLPRRGQRSSAWTRCSPRRARATRWTTTREVEGLRALDRYTWQVRLKQPNYNFLYYLAYCNLTCAVAREVVEHYGDKVGEHPVGTGPFRLAFWKRSSKMVFEPNPNYREEYFDGDARGRRQGAARRSSPRNKGKRLPHGRQASRSTSSRSRSRATSRSSTASSISSSACPTSSPTSPSPTTSSPATCKRRGITMERTPGHGAHLLLLRHEGPGGRRLRRRRRSRCAARSCWARTWAPRSRIARKNQAIPAHSPIGPGAAGYDPDFRSTATRVQPGQGQGAARHVRLRRLQQRRLARPAAQGARATSASRSRSSTPRRPTAQQKPLDENWKKNMDAIGINMTFKKEKWPDLLKESKAGKLQMWGLGWSAAVPDADSFFVMLYGPNGGQANHARFQLAGVRPALRAGQAPARRPASATPSTAR